MATVAVLAVDALRGQYQASAEKVQHGTVSWSPLRRPVQIAPLDWRFALCCDESAISANAARQEKKQINFSMLVTWCAKINRASTRYF